VLVRYSFDDDRIETGPDTFSVFEKARGSVGLSQALRFSGYRALEIADAAGDGDFPELQGYFAPRRDGMLYLHFALLVADPREELNVALAGPGGFQLGPDGIAFWLTTRDGVLTHVSDSIVRRLAPLSPFTWYRVDVAYDVARGRYDLALAEEQSLSQLVLLQDQPAAASQAGSAVDKFSFIGDLRDASRVRYVVDDVVVGTDAAVQQLPFVAPGRRKLFFDAWLEDRARGRDRVLCPPVAGADDLGLSPEAARAVLTARAEAAPPALAPDQQRAVEALALFAEGCAALEGGDGATARGRFQAALERAPGAPLYAAAAALAEAAAGRHAEADARWRAVAHAFRGDPREALLLAQLGRARGDLDAAAWLAAAGAEAALAAPDPASLELAEQHFFALAFADRTREAAALAETLAARLAAAGTPSADWWERAGDAAVFEGDLARAIARYDAALALEPARAAVHLKLSDLHFARGDLARERLHRERIFGSL
jgi:Tfp pilus assembly protein PilF